MKEWLCILSPWFAFVGLIIWDAREMETWRTKLSDPLTVFTAFLAAGTIALATIALLQWGTLEKTDDTSRLRDRAFVYFGDPPLTPYPPDKPTMWGVGIIVLNAGNMPARSIVIQYDCPDAAKAEKITDPFSLAKWKEAEIGNVIGPKNNFRLQACQIPIATVQAAIASEIDVFYVVRVTYHDGFDPDKLRVTQMSRNFRVDQYGGQSLGFVGPHNCSDDDCPSDR